MPKMKWDQTGDRLYEIGTDKFALYLQAANGTYPAGVPWNGIRTFNDNPEGGDATDLYADNIKYLSIRGTEKFNFTIGAYTYPDEFAKCDGSAIPVAGVRFGQQRRHAFGLVGRTLIGNDVDFEDYGYKLHLVYGATAGVSSKEYNTVNESPEAMEMSWDCETTPVAVDGFKAVAHIEIDSTKADPTILAQLEDILYGTDGTFSYDAASPEEGDNPSDEGWYERSGSEGSYIYTPTTDTTVDSSKTYYVQTETGGTTGRLPLPAEVLKMFGYTA